jgi:hypothetical protein
MLPIPQLHAITRNMSQINNLKYIDGIFALVLGVLWGCRQLALSSSYNALSKCNLVVMRWLSLVLLIIVMLSGVAYIIVCLSLTRDDFAAPATTSVVVGQLVAWALETKTQSRPYNWLTSIQHMRKITRYRVGTWEKETTRRLFKEVRGPNCLTDPIPGGRSTWETYKANNRYYIKSWDNMERHYKGNIEPCKNAIEYKNRLAAAAACASMMFSWIKISEILLTDMVDYIEHMIHNSGSIMACIGSWRNDYMKSLLRGDLDTDVEETVSKLAVCWLEKPREMMDKIRIYERRLNEHHKRSLSTQPVT